jgi:CO/xanthine dehydrogenase FAD-binding subunit
VVAAPFAYRRAACFEEAVQVLAEHGEEAKLLAGGQSLMPMLNLRLARPGLLVDLNPIDAGPVEDRGRVLRLPSLTRHRTLKDAELVRRRCPVLAAAAAHIGNVRTRARGTIGGSLAHADPTGELPLVTIALGAEVSALGPGGARDLAVRDLLVSYLTTSLEPDEVITEVRVPTLPPGAGWSFQEVARRTSDWMVVGVAAVVELDPDRDTVAALSLAFGGVADRPWLVEPALLAGLLGKAPEEPLLKEVAARIAETAVSEDGMHASGAYRQRLVAVLGRRALAEAASRARGNGRAV